MKTGKQWHFLNGIKCPEFAKIKTNSCLDPRFIFKTQSEANILSDFNKRHSSKVRRHKLTHNV